MSVPAWALDANKFAKALDRVHIPQFLLNQAGKFITHERASTPNSSSIGEDAQIELFIKTLFHLRREKSVVLEYGIFFEQLFNF